tara:strand:+ start:42162 stop:42458 length:297 start_codon:yes stop_codon:yes gene_type:complete
MSTKITKNQEKVLKEKIFLDKQEVSILEIMNNIKDLMIVQSVNRESESAFFYFFLTFFFALSGFIVMWYLATKFTSIAEYFNTIFCRNRKFANYSADY